MSSSITDTEMYTLISERSIQNLYSLLWEHFSNPNHPELTELYQAALYRAAECNDESAMRVTTLLMKSAFTSENPNTIETLLNALNKAAEKKNLEFIEIVLGRLEPELVQNLLTQAMPELLTRLREIKPDLPEMDENRFYNGPYLDVEDADLDARVDDARPYFFDDVEPYILDDAEPYILDDKADLKAKADLDARADSERKKMNPLYYTAIIENNLRLIQDLLSEDPSSVHVCDDDGKNPVELALENPNINPEIVRCLLEARANVDVGVRIDDAEVEANVRNVRADIDKVDNAKIGALVVANQPGKPSLYTAISSNDLPQIQALLSEDPSSVHSRYHFSKTPLLLALENANINPEIVQCLLDAGADVDDVDSTGRSALIIASRSANSEVVECILNHIDEKIIFKSKTLNHCCHRGMNALHWACEYGRVEVVKTLLQGGLDPFTHGYIRDKTFDGPLRKAIRRKQVVITQLLLRHNLEKSRKQILGAQKQSLLRLAVQNGDEAAVDFILEYDYPSSELLDIAATKGYFSIVKMLLAADKKNFSIVKMLLGREGYLLDPIISAAKGNHSRILTALLEHGISPNYPNWKGITALMTAAMNNSVESVSVLCEAEADPNIRCSFGNTALMYLNIIDKRGEQILELLLRRGGNLRILNTAGENVLTQSVINNRLGNIIPLLKRNVNADMKNKKGESPLFIALKSHRLDIARCLIEGGADFNQPLVTKKDSLLHFFVQTNDVLVSKFLLANGADINKKDHKGKTPLEYATKETRQELTVYMHEITIKKRFPKKCISKETLRSMFSYGPIADVLSAPFRYLSEDSPLRNKPAMSSTLSSILEHFSRRCANTEGLNEKEAWCLKVILDDYDRGLLPHDLLSDAIRNVLLDQEPFCLLHSKEGNKEAVLTPDKHMEFLEKLIVQARALPLSADTRESMLNIVLPGMQKLITERKNIVNHLLHNFGKLYMLNPKLPLHSDHQENASEQEIEALIDRILDNILGAALICMKHGRLNEYFDKLSTGLCLEGRSREVLTWVVTDVIPSKIERTFDDLMKQYLEQEYHPYSEVLQGGNLAQREYFLGTAEFIAKRHAGAHCAIDEKYAPQGVITRNGIHKYLQEVICLNRNEDTMISEGKSIESIGMFR